jgi:hypothetical protein
MLPDNEEMVMNMAENLARNLMGNSLSSSYPQLVPVLQMMGMDLRNVFNQMMGGMRSELFFGESPWAKLYTMQTGKKIGVPRKEPIIENLAAEHWNRSPSRPLRAIMDYWMVNRPEERDGDDEFVFNTYDPEHDQVTVDMRTGETVFCWDNNEMQLTLPEFHQNKGLLTCPLFEKPYGVTVEAAYLDKMLYTPLYEYMVGTEHREPPEKLEWLLMDHYWGTQANPEEGAGESAFNQLRILLAGEMYTKYEVNHTWFEWRGYRVKLSSKRDWDYSARGGISDIVYISSVGIDDVNARDGIVYINDWYRNPLLVNDLLNDMDGIADDLLTRHELSMKEV